MTVDKEFSVGLDLFDLSPVGLLYCARDWIKGAKNRYGFDVDFPGLEVAKQALAAQPELFVGAKGPDWSDSPREEFWSLYFQARKAGVDMGDLKSILSPLDKKALVMGAKEMMIAAAKAKDTDSFDAMLALGAARRSKLLMFSAYQNGGKTMAARVKQPTPGEAGELIGLGASVHAWRTSRAVSHDWEGLSWLIKKSGVKLDGMVLANIAANSEESDFLVKAAGELADSIEFTASKEYHHGLSGYAMHTEEDSKRKAIVSMVCAGHPEGAKAIALAAGGKALWKEVCENGFRSSATFPAREGFKDQSGATRPLSVGYLVKPQAVPAMGMTIQAAAALSGNVEAVMWARREYEAQGFKWSGSQELSKVYDGIVQMHHVDKKGLAEKSIALSDFAELRGGIYDPAASEAKTGLPKKRAMSL